LNVALRLSSRWQPMYFGSISSGTSRSLCTIWHTNSCSMMVTKSLPVDSGFWKRWFTGPALLGRAHLPQALYGHIRGGRTAEPRDGQRTAHAVCKPLRPSSNLRAKLKPNERGWVSSQEDRPQGVQQAFRFSPHPKCIQYFPTLAEDHRSAFTPWQTRRALR
jgi:hypothetical protein